jgi:hypothetical protein
VRAKTAPAPVEQDPALSAREPQQQMMRPVVREQKPPRLGTAQLGKRLYPEFDLAHPRRPLS